MDMVAEGAPAAEIDQVVSRMGLHGWLTDALLPAGWFYRKIEFMQNGKDRRSFEYCTEAGSVLSGHKGAFLHLTREGANSPRETVDRLTRFADRNGGMRQVGAVREVKREGRVVEEVKMEVVREVVSQEEEERTREELEAKEKERREEVERRREEQEVREKERREEELKERVRRSRGKAKVGEVFRAFEERGEREAVLVEVGWKFNRFLPAGWMCREAEPKRVKILNPEGKVLVSIQQVVDHLASSPSYTRDDLNKFLLYPEGTCSEARRSKFQTMVREKHQVGEARQVEEQMEQEEATVEEEEEVQEVPVEEEEEVQEVPVEEEEVQEVPEEEEEVQEVAVEEKGEVDNDDEISEDEEEEVELVDLEPEEKDVLEVETPENTEMKVVEEDWKSSDHLPEGWTWRETPESASEFAIRSPDGTLSTSLKAAAGYMEFLGLSQEAINTAYSFMIEVQGGGEEEREEVVQEEEEQPVEVELEEGQVGTKRSGDEMAENQSPLKKKRSENVEMEDTEVENYEKDETEVEGAEIDDAVVEDT